MASAGAEPGVGRITGRPLAKAIWRFIALNSQAVGRSTPPGAPSPPGRMKSDRIVTPRAAAQDIRGAAEASALWSMRFAPR
jgi:hypothetical protein